MRLILRNLSSILFALVIALGGGILSARWALDHFGGFSELAAGEWVSYPLAGSPHADPYAKARSARLGNLALGAAEGLIFYAHSSTDGKALMRGCTYKMTGTSLNTRFWTIFATDDEGNILTGHASLPTSLLSNHVIQSTKGGFEITIGPQAETNNWLSVTGHGQFTLVMTLYDTPIASSASFSEISMPTITALRDRSNC